MPFLILCFVLALIFQLLALCATSKRAVHLLSFLCMELFPVAGVLYYAIARPGSFFGWESNVVLCLYTAAAIFLGCACAWAARHWRKNG